MSTEPGPPARAAVAIRRRDSGDLAPLAAIVERAHAERGYPAVLPADLVAWLGAARFKASFVAVEGDEVIGQVSIAAAAGDAAEAAWSEALGVGSEQLAAVKRLVVDPSREGRGAGRALLEAAVGAAHAGGRWPVLDVHDRESRAVELYEAAGWRLVARLVVPPGAGIECATLPVRCYAGPPPPRP